MTKKRMMNFVLFLPAFLWMGIIFYLSSRQKIAVSENYVLSFFIFKTIHFIEYGILFLLWKVALYNKSYGTKLAIAFSILYGLSDELHQTFVPTREGKLRDVFIDSLGVFFFWYFFKDKFEKLILKNRIISKIIPV